jgi:hypothetical protein
VRGGRWFELVERFIARVGPFEFGDAMLRGGEPVLEVEDTGGGIQRDAVIDQLADACGGFQLTPRVAAMATVGPVRADDARRIKAAEERGLNAEQLRGLPHGDRRVVLVVESPDSTAHVFLPSVRAGPGPAGHTAGPDGRHASISRRPLSPAVIVIFRGFALSATGMRRVSTPAS